MASTVLLEYFFVLFTETTANLEILYDSDEDNFKYPTTPYPDPVGEGSTIPPYNPDEENDGTIKVNGPIITGNKTCSK